jgi:hypothetical protein
VAAEYVGRKASPVHESHRWPERLRRRKSDEVQPGHGRLERRRKHRRARKCTQTGTDVDAQELQPFEVDAVTSRRDDVIGADFFIEAVGRDVETDTAL